MKIWLSIEWLFYLFGLELCEGEIKHTRNTESVKTFQDTFDILAEFSTGIGKIKWLDVLIFNDNNSKCSF